jgi:hypothetical protein
MAAINRSELYLTIHSHVAENFACVHIRYNHDFRFSLTTMYISGSVELLSLESVAIAVDVDVDVN